LAKHDELDKSIDRSLDDFGRFLRRKWWLVILVLAVGWWLIVNGVPQLAALRPSDVLGFVVQIGLLIFVVIAQFIAIFWFIGRPRVYWVMPGETGIDFNDYKGNPEVLEAARRVVILLRGVKSFKEMGGEISRGMLLIGPPGTGKSYLAQCISTEAGLPFGYASAASFRGMFWGMDVMIVKSLYRKARRFAREHGGCILFVDEFDAIGMTRAGGQGNTMGLGGGMMGLMGGGNGGLNELLMQMDPPPQQNSWWKNMLRPLGLFRGRIQREPVLTIGATNMPEALDPALMRPGRFDIKIVVAPPTDRYRGEVIEYYLNKVRHEDIPLHKLVSDMMGYTPVAIKHVINEAAVLAHFDGRNSITYKDIGAARETHEYGIRYPRTLSPLEKRRLAYHEAGHSVAQAKLLPRHRVSHVTIMKRMGIAGAEAFAEAKPLEEIVTESADEIFADIEVSLASRASEELFLNSRLNGVGGDLHHATQRAIHYIAHWGMSDSFFSAAASLAPERIYTDPILRAQVEDLLRKAYADVRALLDRHHTAVIAVAEALIVREELDSEEIEELIRKAEAPSLGEIAAAALADVPPPGEEVPMPAAIAAPSANGHGIDPDHIVEGQIVDLPPVQAPSPEASTTSANGTPSATGMPSASANGAAPEAIDDGHNHDRSSPGA
jgi:cell division protease FtsH